MLIFPSQAAECLRCQFAPWAARFARADRTDKARPRRWLCWDLPGLAERKKPACLERSSPPLPKARGRLGPCGHGPAECLRCQFAPRGGELTLALVRGDNARPRRRFRWDVSSFFPAANGPSRASELTARTLPGPLYGPSRDLARAATHQRDGDFKNLQDILLVNSFRCLLLNGSTRRSRWDGSRATSRRSG